MGKRFAQLAPSIPRLLAVSLLPFLNAPTTRQERQKGFVCTGALDGIVI